MDSQLTGIYVAPFPSPNFAEDFPNVKASARAYCALRMESVQTLLGVGAVAAAALNREFYTPDHMHECTELKNLVNQCSHGASFWYVNATFSMKLSSLRVHISEILPELTGFEMFSDRTPVSETLNDSEAYIEVALKAYQRINLMSQQVLKVLKEQKVDLEYDQITTVQCELSKVLREKISKDPCSLEEIHRVGRVWFQLAERYLFHYLGMMRIGPQTQKNYEEKTDLQQQVCAAEERVTTLQDELARVNKEREADRAKIENLTKKLKDVKEQVEVFLVNTKKINQDVMAELTTPVAAAALEATVLSP